MSQAYRADEIESKEVFGPLLDCPESANTFTETPRLER
jgi:hypothetical protein